MACRNPGFAEIFARLAQVGMGLPSHPLDPMPTCWR